MGPGRRRWRLALFGLVATTSIGAAYLLLPLAVRGLVRVLGVILSACVWLASALSSGASAWTILGTVGGAIGRAALSTEALTVMAVLVLVGAVALYGLQRLLGFEEESSR